MTAAPELVIGTRRVSIGEPVLIVAELSANHHQSLNTAIEMVYAAKKAGADAVKLQTYTADTMTIDCDTDHFRVSGGTPWDGQTLHNLYDEAQTPWEWHAEIQRTAEDEGLIFFSTPFDATAVDFLEDLQVPAYKVASFEIVDLALIEKISATGKPIILSTGMATADEIERAVTTARGAGTREIALLRCTSAYPARPEEADLRTIPDLVQRFGVVSGVSDHTLGISVPVAAVALGALIVEKHFTLSRDQTGPDSSFSLEPQEFKAMAEAIRTTEQALGTARYGPREGEAASTVFRRSLFAVKDIAKNEPFNAQNVRSIRPGFGLPPADIDRLFTYRAARKIERGTPLNWDMVDLDETPAEDR
jgi:N-acetylneuraminate synthase